MEIVLIDITNIGEFVQIVRAQEQDGAGMAQGGAPGGHLIYWRAVILHSAPCTLGLCLQLNCVKTRPGSAAAHGFTAF